MQINEIVILRLATKEDVVGKLIRISPDSLTLEYPMYITHSFTKSTYVPGVWLSPYMLCTTDSQIGINRDIIISTAMADRRMINYFYDNIANYNKLTDLEYVDLFVESKNELLAEKLDAWDIHTNKAN